MTERHQLPNRRRHEFRAFTFRGRDYTVGFSRFDDGSLSEIFLENGTCTSDLASDARDAAVALSIALQYGVPAEAIRDAVTRGSDGEASGILGCVLDLLTIVADSVEYVRRDSACVYRRIDETLTMVLDMEIGSLSDLG